MKRCILTRSLSLLCALLFLFPIGIVSASAAASPATIFLLDTPHRDLLGVSLDTELLPSLEQTGPLGLLVFAPPAEPRRWFIDAALVEDIQALAVKEVVAQEWLAGLKITSAADPVFAIPYGHPELSMAKKLAPSELTYYYETSKSRLQVVLAREVLINRDLRWSSHSTKIPAATVESYTLNRRALVLLNTVVPPVELDLIRSKLAFLLSTDITNKRQLLLARNADDAIAIQQHRVRIVAGKYRLTSAHEKVPITLVNDFASPVTLQLRLIPLNSRIHVQSIKRLTLLPNSKIQLSIPVTVIASGSTAVLAQFANLQGDLLPDSVLLALNLSVISPTVAWFTTGAALLLFLAAITQSVRRIRKSRK